MLWLGRRKRWNVGIVLGLLCMLAMLGGCSLRQPHTEALTLTVLHTNDTHSYLGGVTKEGRICYAPVCAGGMGGVVRELQAVTALRRDAPNVLLLDAGDRFQGTLFFTRSKETLAAQTLNALSYDAFVPGNHEFDEGGAVFSAFVRQLQVPVVAANLESPLKLPPWIITERQGVRIGIVGLLMEETHNVAAVGKDFVFTEARDALRRAVAELTRQNVSIIIALTHLGLESDRALAQSVDGIDLIVGGHSHSVLSNTEPDAAGPYPLVEHSPHGDPVLVVTAGYAGLYLGKLSLHFSRDGVVQTWQGEPFPLTDTVLTSLRAPAPDPALVSLMQDSASGVQSLLKTPLGQILVEPPLPQGTPLELPNVLECRRRECLSGILVTDSMRAATGADIALLNGGALRNPLPVGSVTPGDVLATLPFEDTLYQAELSGAVIAAALEHGVSRYEQSRGSFLQVSGLRFVFDPKATPRVQSVQVIDRQGNWKALDPEARYNVCTLSFVADGGDGFTALAGAPWKNTGLLISDVVQKYFLREGTLPIHLEGRIQKQEGE